MPDGKIQVRSKVWLVVSGRPMLGPGRRKLLQAIDEQGSIQKAARVCRLTYRKAWGQIKEMEEQLGLPLVTKMAGGPGGGGARLTPGARDLLERYEKLIAGIEGLVNGRFQEVFL